MIGNSAVKEGEWDRHSRPPHAVPRWHDAHNFARGRTLPVGRSVWPFTATALMPRHKSVRPSSVQTFLARGLPPFDLRFGFGISQRPRTQTPINAAVYIAGGEKRDLLDCLE